MKKILALTLGVALLSSGCAQTAPEQTQPTKTQTQNNQPAATIVVEELFTDRDRKDTYDTAKSARITLNGASATCDSGAVKIDGSTVTILDEGTYILSGTLTDGQIIVNADKEDKTQMVLSGARINNSTGAAICVMQADKVFITLDKDTENVLQNGGSFAPVADANVDGVIFSKEDLTLNGSGNLWITSPAGHGIVSKDGLVITGGSYTVNCASHGFAGKDSVCVDGGSFTVDAGKDGIHAENNDDTSLGFVYVANGVFDLTCGGDGISAAGKMQLDGGSYTIVTGGGSENAQKQTSDRWGNMGPGFGGFGGGVGGRPDKGGQMADNTAAVTTTEDSTSIKGIKASAELAINGGSYDLNCADDGIHSNSDLTVTGGSFTIATGDDGLHADETLTVTGGSITISESYEGLEGLHIKITGGKITLTASDDGLNAAGGTDQSGFGGVRGDQFGGKGGRPGMGGGFGGSSNGSILISGGSVDITASGDGIDANGTLQITGGSTVVCGPTQGDTATLDYDVSGTITGGTFIGTGAAGMAQSITGAGQGVIAVRASGTAGAQIKLTDSSGKVLIDHTPRLDFAVVILSCPELRSGKSYRLTIGDQTNEIQAS